MPQTESLSEAQHASALAVSLEADAGFQVPDEFARGPWRELPVAMAILSGPDHVFQLANARYLALLGRKEADLLGRPLREVMPDVFDELSPTLDEVRASRACVSTREQRIACGVGAVREMRFVELTCHPLSDANGATAVMMLAVDVTKHVITKEALELSERRFRTLAENASDVIVRVDRALRYVYANPAAARAFGVRRDEFAGKRNVEIGVPAELSTEWESQLRGVFESGKPRRFEFSFTGPDGLRQYETRLSPEFDASGLLTVLAVARDVTQRKQAEEQLRLSEERFRQLSEAMPQLVWTAHADGTVDYYNTRCAEFAGISKATNGTWRWKPIVHPDELSATIETWRRAVQEGSAYEMEHRLQRADGRFTWYVSRAAPVRDAQGKIVKWIGTATDIDALKRAEEQATHRAVFAQQLIGIVSHDLRTPLSNTALAVHGLLRGPSEPDDKTLRALMRIQRSNDRAVRMVNDLLDFTQARLAGGIPVVRTLHDFHAITRDRVEELRAMHPERDISMEQSGSGRGEWDADRVGQVVQNLLANALKYSPSDSQVSVRTREDGEHLVLSVHNWGTPIAVDRLTHLFEPLQRGTRTSERGERSVGLGLYIVRHIAEAHGGWVEVTSTKEEGTTFEVTMLRHDSR